MAKRNFLFAATLLTMVVLAGRLSAATYYVRTDGNDGNAGTGSDAASAWATINHAATAALSSDDVVYVQSGIYAETVAPTVDGTSGNPIQFIADTAGAVSGWSPGAGNGHRSNRGIDRASRRVESAVQSEGAGLHDIRENSNSDSAARRTRKPAAGGSSVCPFSHKPQ